VTGENRITRTETSLSGILFITRPPPPQGFAPQFGELCAKLDFENMTTSGDSKKQTSNGTDLDQAWADFC
jgi:hypothetical protein